MLQFQQAHGWGDGTGNLWMAQAEHARYRAALGVIQDTATVAGRCPCCLVVAQIATQALTLPTRGTDDWRYCEA